MDLTSLFLGIIAVSTSLRLVLEVRQHGIIEDGYKFFRDNLDGIGVMPGPSEGFPPPPGMARVEPPESLLRAVDKIDALREGKRIRLNCRFPCAENDEGGSAQITEEKDGSLSITVIENNSLLDGEPSQSMASVRIGPTGTRMLTDALVDGWNGHEPPGDEYVEPIRHEADEEGHNVQ